MTGILEAEGYSPPSLHSHENCKMGITVTAAEAARLCHVEPKIISEKIRTGALRATLPAAGRRKITPTKTGPVRYAIDTDDLVEAGLHIDMNRLSLLRVEKHQTGKELTEEQAALIQSIPALQERLERIYRLLFGDAERTDTQRPLQQDTGSDVYEPLPASSPSATAFVPRPARVVKSYQSRAHARRAPADYVRVTEFATAHESVRSTIMGQVNTGRLATTGIEIEGSRAGRKEQWLSPDQMIAAIAYWNTMGTPYTPCGECPGCLAHPKDAVNEQ